MRRKVVQINYKKKVELNWILDDWNLISFIFLFELISQNIDFRYLMV